MLNFIKFDNDDLMIMIIYGHNNVDDNDDMMMMMIQRDAVRQLQFFIPTAKCCGATFFQA